MSAAAHHTLIIVACHAVYVGGSTDGHDESEWLLESFQAGETPTFVEHIRRGIEEVVVALKKGEEVLLVFSGGATKRAKTNGRVVRTEAEGYLDVAMRRKFFEFDDSSTSVHGTLRHRIFTEDYATDSYQNILLSLIQYPIWRRRPQVRERLELRESSLSTNNNDEKDEESVENVKPLKLPNRLVIISHAFKRSRFVDLHLPAIRSLWPSPTAFDAMKVEYIGIDPPFDEQKIQEIAEGDRKRGYGVWKHDLWGIGDVLSVKRKERGWDEAAFVRYLAGFFDGDDLGELKRLVRGMNSGAG